ncbi:hypothetical protein BCR44DRAFT_46747 [Catenaria anguillulae PL171]|uniref:Uncharacterized protein n=1 Tax=Catenaria anguillulae PL171 TaxID=765915 RepID=A0A1Y2HHU8_9FUNG|nr:hypothetical protein BCR44DRAFT_46747 [Catenaria anguillulae PL171]
MYVLFPSAEGAIARLRSADASVFGLNCAAVAARPSLPLPLPVGASRIARRDSDPPARPGHETPRGRDPFCARRDSLHAQPCPSRRSRVMCSDEDDDETDPGVEFDKHDGDRDVQGFQGVQQ